MSDPMDRVSHINRSKSGMTKMQITLSIEMRALMAEASERLGMSQLSLIRSAISAYLQAHSSQKVGETPADSTKGTELLPHPPVEQGPVIVPEPVPEPLPGPAHEPEPGPPVANPEPDSSIVPAPSLPPGQNGEVPKRSPRRGPGGRKGGKP